ncbi:putative AraC family transcriptional regulator [Flavihumibacter petaseus NBRC 106054]|uniref:Putative AraC family transcriptional regulator n=2 Tax=Flavihumibacter TaxID=1004301 RepID=A0A0E9N6P7_9BACT|nr:putative AraC family transcriptional regulator [Flavihumibacter petaseus NBRC 106054]
MEFIFNLGDGFWKTQQNERFLTTPPVELWGQITQPLRVKAGGKNHMLGVRFYPHAASLFLRQEASHFNDQVMDLRDVVGGEVVTLYEQLLNTPVSSDRISVLETWLLQRIAGETVLSGKMPLISQVVNDLSLPDNALTVETVASRYNISPRYLHKLFVLYTGIGPKSFMKIRRFRRSLALLRQENESLTAVAYEAGYFDQAHFIREFKAFTGLVPSAYSADEFPVSQATTES